MFKPTSDVTPLIMVSSMDFLFLKISTNEEIVWSDNQWLYHVLDTLKIKNKTKKQWNSKAGSEYFNWTMH